MQEDLRLRRMQEDLQNQKNAGKSRGLKEYREIRGCKNTQGGCRPRRMHEVLKARRMQEGLRAQKNAGTFEGSEECRKV